MRPIRTLANLPPSTKLYRCQSSNLLRGSFVMACLVLTRFVPAAAIELPLQTRDPQSGAVTITPTKIDPTKLGVVVVDIWNWHWCKTAAARVNSFVPRMDVCLDQLRGLGATIFLCPTDVVDAYVGTPQRERALAVKTASLPEPIAFSCPAPPNGPGCACLVHCRGNYGWNAMNPKLSIGKEDLMPNSRQVLYTLAKQRDITHLLYMGVHTQVCLLGKEIGLRNMKALGFECILARDLTDSHPDYDPERGIDPDDLTARTVAHFEKYLCSTVNLKEQLARLGHWPHQRPLDPVRAAPWGTQRHPHLFADETLVTLSAPLQPRAEIRYTLDGSPPTQQSARYGQPLPIDRTTTIRAQAFRDQQPVCVESTFQYFKLFPRPPVPDVYLADLQPDSVLGPGHSPSDSSHRFSPVSRPPQSNRSNRGEPLRIGGKTYAHGIGAHAPNRMLYQLDPSWSQFVGLVGVDENLVDTNHGSDLGCLSSVVFRVFIDGELVAESPIMRFMQPAWHFTVPIPAGAEKIALVAHPTEDGNREDLANWVDAGFVVGTAK